MTTSVSEDDRKRAREWLLTRGGNPYLFNERVHDLAQFIALIRAEQREKDAGIARAKRLNASSAVYAECQTEDASSMVYAECQTEVLARNITCAAIEAAIREQG